MLVLSRRANEQIVFPTLGISVSVERIDSRRVRLGIDAPSEVPVLRHELLESQSDHPQRGSATNPKRDHELRNRLNAVSVRLHLLQRQLELGHVSNVTSAIEATLNELQRMENMLARSSSLNASLVEKPRALIVDDCRNESELLAEYLRTFDYEVFTVENGIECLEFLASHTRPDVILLDMNMPRMDGKAAVRSIRENPAHDGIKVFAVSGISQEAACIETGPNGVDRWFTKPIRPNELVEQMKTELEAA